MYLSTSLLPFLLLLPTGIFASPAAPLSARNAVDDCRCRRGTDPGEYCGYCDVFEYGSRRDFAYKCDRDGYCREYGWRDSCDNRRGTCGEHAVGGGPPPSPPLPPPPPP